MHSHLSVQISVDINIHHFSVYDMVCTYCTWQSLAWNMIGQVLDSSLRKSVDPRSTVDMLVTPFVFQRTLHELAGSPLWIYLFNKQICATNCEQDTLATTKYESLILWSSEFHKLWTKNEIQIPNGCFMMFPKIVGNHPKWMVKIRENPYTFLWMIWEVFHHLYFWFNTQIDKDTTDTKGSLHCYTL